MVKNNNGWFNMNNYNQKISCYVTDCEHCIDGCYCGLKEIHISNDIKNENSKYNTMCQSYEEKI